MIYTNRIEVKAKFSFIILYFPDNKKATVSVCLSILFPMYTGGNFLLLF